MLLISATSASRICHCRGSHIHVYICTGMQGLFRIGVGFQRFEGQTPRVVMKDIRE
jgi:hypothetical protein